MNLDNVFSTDGTAPSHEMENLPTTNLHIAEG